MALTYKKLTDLADDLNIKSRDILDLGINEVIYIYVLANDWCVDWLPIDEYVFKKFCSALNLNTNKLTPNVDNEITCLPAIKRRKIRSSVLQKPIRLITPRLKKKRFFSKVTRNSAELIHKQFLLPSRCSSSHWQITEHLSRTFNNLASRSSNYSTKHAYDFNKNSKPAPKPKREKINGPCLLPVITITKIYTQGEAPGSYVLELDSEDHLYEMAQVSVETIEWNLADNSPIEKRPTITVNDLVILKEDSQIIENLCVPLSKLWMNSVLEKNPGIRSLGKVIVNAAGRFYDYHSRPPYNSDELWTYIYLKTDDIASHSDNKKDLVFSGNRVNNKSFKRTYDNIFNQNEIL